MLVAAEVLEQTHPTATALAWAEKCPDARSTGVIEIRLVATSVVDGTT